MVIVCENSVLTMSLFLSFSYVLSVRLHRYSFIISDFLPSLFFSFFVLHDMVGMLNKHDRFSLNVPSYVFYNNSMTSAVVSLDMLIDHHHIRIHSLGSMPWLPFFYYILIIFLYTLSIFINSTSHTPKLTKTYYIVLVGFIGFTFHF